MATVKVIDHGLDKLVKNASTLGSASVSFGIQSDAGVDPESGVDLVDIAIFNELGTATIPARPFMRDFAEKNENVLAAAMQRQAARIEAGTNVDEALGELGEFAVKHQKDHVRQSGKWAVPNAASTIKRKGSNVPLIDDGVMLGAIRHEVIK